MIYLISAIGLIVGSFLIFQISPLEWSNELFQSILDKPKSIKEQINEAAGNKKPNFLKREMIEVKNVLIMTGRSDKFSIICVCSLAFFAVGAIIAILLGNVFLVLPLGFGMFFLPLWYVKLTANHYKKDIASELETALSIITTAYLRCEDILTSIEENINYLNPPIQTVFNEFLQSVKMINADIPLAIKILKTKVENEVFWEWCDGLLACQMDRSIKNTLTPIVNKLSDIRIVNAELDYLVFEPRKEFITMVFLVLGNIPLMYFLNKSWYETLMHTVGGKIILAISVVVIFVSTAFVLKFTKPIEFKR